MSDQAQPNRHGGVHRAGAESDVPDLDSEVGPSWRRPRDRGRLSGESEAATPDPAPAEESVGVSVEAGARRAGRRASTTPDPEAVAAEQLAADRAAVAAQGETLRRAAARRRESDAVRPRASIEGGERHVVPTPEAGSPLRAVSTLGPAERRLVAGGVFERPLDEAALRDLDGARPTRSAHAAGAEARAPQAGPVEPGPVEPGTDNPSPVAASEADGAPANATPAAADPVDELATRAIAVVREPGPGPSAEGPAVPFRPDRTLVMGILNVTLDSFSDGGRYAHFDDAIAHARALVAEGADIIDVGGESTRPGAARVDVGEEQRRVIPVIRELAGQGIRVSVDTMNAATALAAVEAGADIINDVSGGLADQNMVQVVADTDRTYIAMHWRGHSTVMADNAVYGDAVDEVKAELFHRVAEMVVRGVNPDRIVIDPGLGFAKLAEHNWQLLGHLDELAELGLPILVAASRKRFLGGLLPEAASVRDRDPATAVISALSAQAGAWGVRVHDVASTRAALDVWEAWQKGSRG